MYDGFWKDWSAALDAFVMREWQEKGPVMYVEAEADTGSRYVVSGAWLETRYYNDSVLVTVLQPWQTAWTLMRRGMHFYDYVDEHLRSPHRGRAQSHGGDMAAITVCAHLVTGASLDEALEYAARMGTHAVR